MLFELMIVIQAFMASPPRQEAECPLPATKLTSGEGYGRG